MQNIETLKSQVEAVLRDFPESRNSDITLMIEIWRRFYPQNMGEGIAISTVSFSDLYEMPQEGAVSRVRRFIQNDKTRAKELRYLPTNPEVAKHRRMNEELWKEEVKQNSCSGGRCFFKGSLPEVCPNVRAGYHLHTEVKCQKCGKSHMWGMSWDQDKEKDFICDNCRKIINT